MLPSVTERNNQYFFKKYKIKLRLSDNLKNVCPATVAIQGHKSSQPMASKHPRSMKSPLKYAWNYTVDHTTYERLAVRILADNMNRNSPDKFSDCMSLLAKDDRLDPKFVEVVEKHSGRLDAIANEQPVNQWNAL